MEFSSYGGFGETMFHVVPVIVIAGFVLVFGILAVRAVQGARQWKRNNASPVLTVDALVVSKRTDVHQHTMTNGNMPQMSSSTIYYATFEVAGGDRLEFKIDGSEYGMLAENDRGKLTFQGTRYLGFERDRNS